MPFRFDDMSELCGVIQKKLNGDMKITDDDNKKLANNIANLKIVFSLFTKNGLRSYLAKFKGGEVDQAIRIYERW